MISTPRDVTPRPVRGGGFALLGPLLLCPALVLGVLALLAPEPATGAAKPRHELSVSSEEVGGAGTNEFRVFGVATTYQGRKLRIQSRVNGGPWKLWAKTPTDAEDGSFSQPIYGGKRGSRVCYRVVVPSTDTYRTTKRRAGCITTK